LTTPDAVDRVFAVTRRARIVAAVAAVSAAAPVAAAVAYQAADPPRGTYRGGSNLSLAVAGATISTAAFDFGCRDTTGRITVNEIAVRRSRGRWRFSIRTWASATYRDDWPDQNVRVRFSGRFSRNENRATGTFRVRSPHCGSTGDVQWSARRRPR
jgi:hypothetical protein